MHVLHHLAGRELLTKLPVSGDQIFHLVEEKVLRTVEEIKAVGCPVVEFEWSRKHVDSLITKLLAKKESIAADVYDNLRFRMITNTEEQLVFVLRELTERLVPFNYVIPGQSVNDIIKIRETLSRSPALQRFLPDITDLAAVAADKKPSPQNEFSGPGYRVINFVERSAGAHRQVPLPPPRRSDLRGVRDDRVRADRVSDHRRAHRREQRERREQPRQVQGTAGDAGQGAPHARHEGRRLIGGRRRRARLEGVEFSTSAGESGEPWTPRGAGRQMAPVPRWAPGLHWVDGMRPLPSPIVDMIRALSIRWAHVPRPRRP